MTLDDATRRQVQAADPKRSTWLSANAGSGKTRVLTDRVARLLLEGVSPQNILCLTYTKAAASEMQNRLFDRLGHWAMMDTPALIEQLGQLGIDRSLDAETIRHARTLFARAIETPAGLKIQTIHSFCATLLRRFPLEAGVSPDFSEIDDRRARLLKAEVLEDLALNAPDAVDGLAAHYTGLDITDFVTDVLRNRDKFLPPRTMDDIRSSLGLFQNWAELETVFQESDTTILTKLLPVLQAGSTMDQRAAVKLVSLIGRPLVLDDLPVLESIFLSTAKDGSPKIKAFPTKSSREAMGPDIALIDDLAERVLAARQLRNALTAADRSHALHQFAQAFVPLYEARKTAMGLLDFDDLIAKAQGLLSDALVAQWVLFRLDGGIDHILVDEAQDTSPRQWEVIRLLAQEFTAGKGAKENVPRTIFVVGDKKQSIYSFQGADPQAFDQMRTLFDNELRQVGEAVQQLSLNHSFRSSQAVLDVVDAVFCGDTARAVGHEATHIAFWPGMPGRVDLWPAVEKAETPEPDKWFDPIDRVSPDHHSKRLAQNIASEIERMIAEETIPAANFAETGSKRAVNAGDFLILVQGRSDLFREIIRACKERRLPIAGADRLKVGAELAVKDITALLSFLATPEDDLSLACALRSPLFGWSEQDLFTLAHGRGDDFLWKALRDNGQEYPRTMEVIDELRRMSDFLRPFDLIERLLTRFEGRKALLARLGPEAEEGIDALLTQALAYETTQVPSLTGFLTWLAADDLEIKRQAEGAGDKIRVMTVHGAKGLEAPIVILPDSTKRKPPPSPAIIGEEPAFWTPPSKETPAAIAELKAEAKSRAKDERLRLLYVAMTRAENWLIVCAAGDLGKTPEDSWHGQVGRGLESVSAKKAEFPTGTGLRHAPISWDDAKLSTPTTAPSARTELPAAAGYPAPATQPVAGTIAPSDLGGAKALPGEALPPEEAMLRGTILHALLEHLALAPADLQQEMGERVLARFGSDDPQLIAEAMSVLAEPSLAPLFSADALAEVEVTAPLPTLNRIMQGAIDRLIVDDERVLAVDFKSNALVPARAEDVPEGVLRQMGAYAEALAAIYPQHRIETAIVWTRTASLMPLAHQSVNAALQRAEPG